MLQLAAPLAIRRMRSNRRWVIVSVTLQTLALLPLMVTALVGHISTPLFFLFAAIYWGAGMASGPAWNKWVETLIPVRLRVRVFGRYGRMSQSGLLAGFVGGGLLLALGQWVGRPLWAFAALYLAAAVSRFCSSRFLASQTEPIPADTKPSTGSVRDVVRRLWHEGDGRLLIFLWMTQFTTQIAGPFYAPFLLGHLQFSYLRYMLIIGMPLAVKAVALPALSAVVRRFGARRVLWTCGLAIGPLPALWMISQRTGYLLSIQVLSGIVWGGFELATALVVFEAIDRRQRIGMLTLNSLGTAAATVAGALVGAAVLGLLGTELTGYYAVFGVSAAARLLSMLFTRRAHKARTHAEKADDPLDGYQPAMVKRLAA